MTQPLPSRRMVAGWLAVCGASPWLARTAQAQAYPAKPLRIVVPFAPGGPTDLMARTLARPLSASLGQPVVIDNKPGGGGVIAMTEVARAPADGYTLVFPSIIAVTNPALMANYPFDTLRDFAPLTVVGTIPHALVVRPESPARSVPDLVALAKARPGALSYGSSGNGTSAHLAAALFALRAGVEVTHVPYRGAGPAMQDLLGGQIDFMFLDMSTALGLVKAGRLRALAVAPSNRFPGLPEVPTVAEQGYAGFNVRGWYGLLMRAGTPAPLLQRLHSEIRRALELPEVRETFQAQGIEPGGMTPAEYTALIRDDLAAWRQTVRQLNLSLQ